MFSGVGFLISAKNGWLFSRLEAAKGNMETLKHKSLQVCWFVSNTNTRVNKIWPVRMQSLRKWVLHTQKGRLPDVTKEATSQWSSFSNVKYSSVGRTTSRLVLCATAEQICFHRALWLHGKGEKVRIYSRKLSRVRQGAILGGGLVTFFLLAFISGRMSAKGDWAEFLVQEWLNYY